MIYTGTSPIHSVYLGDTMPWGVYQGNLLVWKRDPEIVEFNGSSTYGLPAYWRYVDIIALGGGGGGREGDGAAARTGGGGSAGNWGTITLERGVTVPYDLGVLTITVGLGGAAGPKNSGGTSYPGGTSGVSSPVAGALVTASGGAGGTGVTGTPGGSPGSVVVDGVTYTGGAQAPSGSGRTNGNPPGGGGGGGAGGIFNGQTAGMAGADGKVWLRIRSF